MGGHITFAGVPITYIIESVDVSKTFNHRDSPYIGQPGADVEFVSSGNRVISFESLCPMDDLNTDGNGYRIIQYINLAETYKEKEAQLVSESIAIPAGNYKVTGFKFKEDTGNNFRITWEFTEVAKFNVTQKTFKVWNKAQALSKAKKTNKKTLDSNTKYLLKTCGTMNTSSNNTKCIKCLQKFLQKQGYYTKHKVNGNYGSNTAKAVKQLQGKHGLIKTGDWDIATRIYFQSKYNYPAMEVIANKVHMDYVFQKSVDSLFTKKKKKKK